MNNTSKIKNCCPNCNQYYQLPGPKQKGNIPLLLACGHSMCENCIVNIMKCNEPIECKICHRDMELKQSDTTLVKNNKNALYQLFPVNIFMLGELTKQSSEETDRKQEDVKDKCYIDLLAIIAKADKTKGECKECGSSTTKMCQQCSAIVCESCFTKSHKNFILFKNHDLINIVPSIEPNRCKTHKEKSLDYYCKDCSKSICMDCMMVGGDKSCKNHNVVSKDEVNEEFAKNVLEVAPKLEEVYKRLTKSAVDVGNILYNIENDTGSTCEFTSLIYNVEQHFSKLFHQIQKHKQEVIDIILKVKSSEKDSLHKAKNDIENSIIKAQKVLSSIRLIQSSFEHKEINFAALLENAMQVVDAPWYLKKDEKKTDPLKVTVNEDLCALVTDYIQLEGNANSEYKLYSTSELPEGVELPPAPVTPVFPPELPKDVRMQSKEKVENKVATTPGFIKTIPQYRSKSGSVSSLNSSESETSYRSSQIGNKQQKLIVQSVAPFEESQQPKQLYEGSQELVYITHIINPHNFFVQRACHQRIVKEMIREFRNAASLPKPSSNHVQEGKVYLMFSKADNMWQRCRILKIDRKDPENPLLHMFSIDFGNSEVTNMDKLRLLPLARLQSPSALAIHCSLANCEPRNGSWTSDDSILIQNIIDNKQAVIHIRHIQATGNYAVKFDCDVTTFEDGVSIAHALVFHERAKLRNPKLPYPKIVGIADKPRLFMNHNDFSKHSVEEVYITHIVSPDKFFVRKRHLQQIYENLCNDLEQEYSLRDNSGTVYLPEIGMVCVVNLEQSDELSAQATWARGVVVELPGRGRARLLLPDTGRLLAAAWSRLRRIRPRFTTLRALATECHLAGVSPLNKKWSPGSVALLQKFEDRLLELHAEDCRNKNSLGVSLYDLADPDNEICLNNEMIKHKFAFTFGLFRFNKDVVQEKEKVVTKKAKKAPSLEATKPTESHIQILKKPTESQDLEAKDKGPIRLEVKVLNYISPSMFYVSLIHQQKTFNELFDQIQKYYSTNRGPCKNIWNVGDKCCSFCTQSKTWRRAIIIEMDSGNAKVFYSDFATSEVVPVANLAELPAEFKSVGDAAIKCHMCAVIPAVGEEWPSVSKEYLQEMFDVYNRIFITKLGNFKNKSMPVEIWVYHTIEGGALEPNKSEWRCLNKQIIEQGLAIPDKSMEQSPSVVATNPDDDGDETLSFLNITGSVRDWLHLDPLPIKPLQTKNFGPEPSGFDDIIEDTNVTANKIDFISDWLPAEPLTNKEFMAMPTYIDNDCVIYLHDLAQQGTLDMIRKALEHRFQTPDRKAKYNQWSIGEPCIAMFYLDNQFYRGRVLEVNDDKSCLVHYIDYGNDERCEFVNMRKNIVLHQIPTQAYKCVLNRISPVGGTWTQSTLDYIHKIIVEKECYVKIVKNAAVTAMGAIPIELKCNKLCINDHLVDFEMAVYCDGSKAVIHKFVPLPSVPDKNNIVEAVSDSDPDFLVADDNDTDLSTTLESFNMEELHDKDWNKVIEEDEDNKSPESNYLKYPKYTDREFLCKIIIINDISLLELNIIHTDETNILYEDIFKKLQHDGGNMTPLNGIYTDKACVALFDEDEQWYRASIMQYSETKQLLKVRYVDFGNVETIPLAQAREIPEAFTELPPASIQVKLHGVTVNADIDVNTIAQEYGNTFLDKGPFNAKVIDIEDSIPLVELRNDNNELVYENLITAGILKRK